MRLCAAACLALALALPAQAQSPGFGDKIDPRNPSSSRPPSKPQAHPPQQHREPERPRHHQPAPRPRADESAEIRRAREHEARLERERQHRERQREAHLERERQLRERQSRGSEPRPKSVARQRGDDSTELQRQRLREREAELERERAQLERERRLLRSGVNTTPSRVEEPRRQPVNPQADVIRQPVVATPAPQARSVTCRAAPVCTQPGRSCRPVEWVYTGTDSLASHRRDIARLCEVANNPDSCGCVPQCAQAVSCSF